jgi:hypothetical protein
MISILQYFQQKGYKHMMIDWTDLLDYYDKVEFKPRISYLLSNSIKKTSNIVKFCND